jgi:hypothetical protein
MPEETSMTERWCKDCRAEGFTASRAAPYPGPRCATHHRAWIKRRKERAHARHIESNFELTAEQYRAIYEMQGGRCALCGIATGKARRLAVEHDHELAEVHDHPVNRGCRLCIRGLACARCNFYGVPLTMPALLRAINYLSDPPARKVLR